jgi:hypothetical protein
MKSRKPGDPMQPRRIHLLSQATDITIDPGAWRGVAEKKTFDDKSTAILRVLKNKDGVLWMVYGMRSQLADGAKKAEVSAEMYELVPMVSLLSAALDKVAKVCGLDPLVADVRAALP